MLKQAFGVITSWRHCGRLACRPRFYLCICKATKLQLQVILDCCTLYVVTHVDKEYGLSASFMGTLPADSEAQYMSLSCALLCHAVQSWSPDLAQACAITQSASS